MDIDKQQLKEIIKEVIKEVGYNRLDGRYEPFDNFFKEPGKQYVVTSYSIGESNRF